MSFDIERFPQRKPIPHPSHICYTQDCRHPICPRRADMAGGLSIHRLSEFQKAESGIVAGGHLEKWGNRSKGAAESRVICSLEIPRGYNPPKGGSDNGAILYPGMRCGEILRQRHGCGQGCRPGQFPCGQGRVRGRHGGLRLRQDHAAEHAVHHRQRHRRTYLLRKRGHHGAFRK